MTLKHDFVETDVRQARTRLTRAAGLVVIVLLFLGVALILTAGRKVATGQAGLGGAPATTSIPAAVPASTPTPTPYVCPDDPADWRVRMAPGLTGQRVGKIDPPCVAAGVLSDLEAALHWYYQTPDRDPAEAARYFADDPLASLAGLMSQTVSSLQRVNQDFQVLVDPEDRLIYVADFALDGRQASVVDRVPGGSVFQTTDRESGELLTQEFHPAHLMRFTLHYDQGDGRWKIARMEEAALEAAGDPQLYRELIETLYGEGAIAPTEEKR